MACALEGAASGNERGLGAAASEPDDEHSPTSPLSFASTRTKSSSQADALSDDSAGIKHTNVVNGFNVRFKIRQGKNIFSKQLFIYSGCYTPLNSISRVIPVIHQGF